MSERYEHNDTEKLYYFILLKYIFELFKRINCHINYIKYCNIMLINLIFLCLASLTLSSEPKLIYIQEVFRHGHRYPFHPSPFDNSTFILSMNSAGELTKQGRSMHYILGQNLHKTYWNKLFDGSPYLSTYNQSKFYVKSTNVNRTIESAQSQLLGIL